MKRGTKLIMMTGVGDNEGFGKNDTEVDIPSGGVKEIQRPSLQQKSNFGRNWQVVSSRVSKGETS